MKPSFLQKKMQLLVNHYGKYRIFSFILILFLNRVNGWKYEFSGCIFLLVIIFSFRNIPGISVLRLLVLCDLDQLVSQVLPCETPWESIEGKVHPPKQVQIV